MGVLTKARHKLTVDGRLYLWWVAENADEPGVSLHVCSADKRYNVQYALDQASRGPAFLVVQGREFAGLRDAGGVYVRIRTPSWNDDRVITPAFVRRLIDWSADSRKTIVRVDYTGRPIHDVRS